MGENGPTHVCRMEREGEYDLLCNRIVLGERTKGEKPTIKI